MDRGESEELSRNLIRAFIQFKRITMRNESRMEHGECGHGYMHHGMKNSEAMFLFRLKETEEQYPEGISISQMSERMFVRPPSVTFIVTSLERKGLIERRMDPADRRIVRIMLTCAGNEFIESHKKGALMQVQGLVEYLGPEKTAQLASLLNEAFGYYSSRRDDIQSNNGDEQMLKIYRNLKPFIPYLIGILIFQTAQTIANLYLPTLTSNITNKGIMMSDVPYIWRTGGLMLLIAAGGVVCAVAASLLGSRTAMGLGRILRSRVFRNVESFSLYEFDKFGASTLMTRTTNDITQIQMTTTMIFNMMVGAPITAIGGTILAYNQDKGLTVILAFALPLIAGLITFFAVKGIPLFRKVQEKLDRVNLVVRENLTGIRVIRAFNRIDSEQKRFDDASRDLAYTYIKVNRIMAFMMPAMMLIMNLVTLSIIWFGAQKISSGDSNIGNLMAFMQYAMQILISLVMLTVMFIMIPRAQAAADRINEVLETKPDITDPDKAKHADSLHGCVEFRNVSFRYHGAEDPVISEITFSAKPGETTAIVGSTGSGKSTVVSLIPRFYDVEGGEVLVDGVDVRELSQQELRAKIGFVPQKAVLFTGTISENLRYGKTDATDEEIRKAASVAQATDFIEGMNDSYETMLSEGGLNLSGGQKQRLSIARALVRRPEIYIFDDSFSALDFKTDAALRAALKDETADATVIIVAQRVGTVMDADRIIVLDDGKIAGIGTHRELMSSCEVYREIVSSQLSEEELA